ncbi:MAG: hypothetical protein DBY41_07505 [Clostridium sp.]|nr:MAG: hypothetical protein DBY41_07505 [Clostridium sp.]
MKFNLKKLNKIIVIPGLVLSSLSIGIMQNMNDVNAYNYITTGSYSGMNATDKAIIGSISASDADLSPNLSYEQRAEIIYASASPISTSTEGLNNISGYQWTGWFDKNKKDFTIDKSVTGNFGTTTKGGKTYNFSTDRTGYYKYLRDPIYSEIRLKASQTFSWVTKKKSNFQNEFSSYNINTTYTSYNGGADAANNVLKQFSITDKVPSSNSNTTLSNYKKSINKAKEKLKKSKTSKYSTIVIGTDKCPSTKETYKVNGHVTVDTTNQKTLLYGNIAVQNHRKITVLLSKPSKKSTNVTIDYVYQSTLNLSTHGFYDITYKNYSQNVQLANTVVARNVSATELSKYKTFYLVSNGGANTSNNTSVSKGNGGWWGSNHPSYHQGNDTTSDSGGWYTWRNDTSSGSKSINLRDAIPEKEKEFNFAAVPSNIGKDNTSTLHINPNGGTYNGNGAETQVKQRVYTFYTVASAIRDGYTLTGWDYSGGGVWNPNTNKYQFNLVDGYLTAKWTDNNDPSDPSNPDDKNKKYTLTVDPNGGKYKGKADTTKITQKKGTSVEVKNPTRSGYLFVGWDVVAGNSNFFSPGTNSSMYKFYGDATIKAQWVKKNDPNSIASVTIDPNGGTYEGSTSIKKITGTPGTSTIIKTPVREGYVFKGWDISNIDKNKYESPTFTFVRGDTTMKARWEKMIIPPCQIGASGKDSCGGDDNEKAPGIWVHLNKDIFS